MTINGDVSIARRQERAAIRKGLKTGVIPLRSVLETPPNVVADLPAWMVIGWTRHCGVKRVAILNNRAIRQGVNLALPLSVLTARHRAWIADNVLPTGQANAVENLSRTARLEREADELRRALALLLTVASPESRRDAYELLGLVAA